MRVLGISKGSSLYLTMLGISSELLQYGTLSALQLCKYLKTAKRPSFASFARLRVKLNHNWSFAWFFKCHQHVSMLASRAVKAKPLIVQFHFCVLHGETRFALFTGKHGQLRLHGSLSAWHLNRQNSSARATVRPGDCCASAQRIVMLRFSHRICGLGLHPSTNDGLAGCHSEYPAHLRNFRDGGEKITRP